MHDVQLPIAIEDIVIPEGREINRDAVNKLAKSIDEIGLRHPITIRKKGEKYILVAGRHRIEACKKLGREHVPASIVSMTNDEARLWEIAENLHRAELKKLERDEHVAEWIKITEKLSVQVAPKGIGHRPEGGISKAARDLDIEETDAKRAIKVASLSDDAKEAARSTGLDDNRSALLTAAKEKEPEQQVAAITKIAAAKLAPDPLNDFESKEKQVAALMAAWNRAGPEAREEFLSRIDQPIMDKRYA